MKYLALLCCLLSLFCVSACDQAKAPKDGQYGAYADVLAKGLIQKAAFLRLPQGRITIMSSLGSMIESGDNTKMQFPSAYLEELRRAQKDGLLSLEEMKQDLPDQITSMGASIFTVTPTEKLRQLADPEQSSATWLAVPVSTVKILEIVSEEACQVKKATPGDAFRLVMGLVSLTPTPQAKTLGPAYGALSAPQQRKFRAVLQYNPFTKTYIFRAADFGRPEESGWDADTVAEMME